MKSVFATLFITVGSLSFSNAQDIITNIYAFDLEVFNDTFATVTNPKFLSDFNNEGYNNQPYFFSDDIIYISSKSEDEDDTDLFALNLSKQSLERVTDTPESEYSPTLMPDKSSISCIKQDAEGNQWLWSYPLDRSHKGQKILRTENRVGYHYWLDKEQLALFLVGDPIKMVITDINTQENKLVSTKIGRCFKPLGNSLAFVFKSNEEDWYIQTMDKTGSKINSICRSLKDSEDFEIIDNKYFISGSGSKLYLHTLHDGDPWIEIADLKEYAITNITRLAYRDGKLILVNRI